MKVRSKRRSIAERKGKKRRAIRKLSWIAGFSDIRSDIEINFIFN